MTQNATLDVTAPFDGEVIEAVEEAGAEQLETALTRARELFRHRDGWLPLDQRIEILTAAAGLLDAEWAAFAALIAHEGGKPLKDAEVEAARAVDGIEIAVDELRTQAGGRIPLGTTAMTRGRLGVTGKEPIGPVVAVSAFNHPLNLIVHQVVPAVAAGCPVIVKPSEDVPLSALRFVDLLRRAGLPEGWCQPFVTSDIPLAEALVTDPRVAFFSFIGSARVGWMLRSRLAPGTRCALEHGGAAPVIVAADADRSATITALLKGGFYHAGQVCVSVQRVFVPRSQAEDYAAALAEGAGELVVGDPRAAATDVGPLIRSRELDRVGTWVDEATAGGARLLCGGQALGASLYAPTVLLDPDPTARVSTQEIFGPVICVYGYDDEADAIAQANSLDVAFQAAVFTADLDRAFRLADRLDASAVMINDHSAFRADGMPFAGLRQSGLGVGGIPYTLADMQVDKLVVLRSDGF